MQNKDICTFMPRKHFEKEKSCMLFQLVENVGGFELRLIPRKHQQKNIQLKVSVQNGNWNKKHGVVMCIFSFKNAVRKCIKI
ncbi:TPA: hypothetical protein PVR85_002899 [Staphylococcus aureus]|nr:hypothetical protein [Staphylococcus aureus]HEH0578909.1 hypothetical protein [Staphylococcus aureus]